MSDNIKLDCEIRSEIRSEINWNYKGNPLRENLVLVGTLSVQIIGRALVKSQVWNIGLVIIQAEHVKDDLLSSIRGGLV